MNGTTVTDKSVLVTGANRGSARRWSRRRCSGRERVYAGARRPFAHPDRAGHAVTLDVTDAAQIQAAVERVERSTS